MKNKENENLIFHQYFKNWISIYKEGGVRKVTYQKYLNTYKWLLKIVPNLYVHEIDRVTYQMILNRYSKEHEKQTTMDFHHHLKAVILDALDDGLIKKDPTRKAIIKGKNPGNKKIKFLNQFQLKTLLNNLKLEGQINWDYLIWLVAKTGLRFSEALALTAEDFDFRNQILRINKTWNYKEHSGFAETKNLSSNRKIRIDWQIVVKFSELLKEFPKNKPIFVNQKIYNSTINKRLERLCVKNNIPIISIHGLRHTHASLLLFAGVSTATVAQRLGHSGIHTTQKTYLHIIQEMENKDIDLIMRTLAIL
ncbi:site-specific integrase [[Mycoplasma] phocae]|uniref:Site-specific integrase n=1 Tax=[Mycoplasma] phocae TaxID=142651 RepID=A0A2Z5IQD0_9BACT|nr:site-specific integrase [[Mycoplasma] phocae]AXE60870.1 site-specific integrase [[Mycoplasma] phocae]